MILQNHIFVSERVTFDMEGLTTEDDPAVPGIRLGDHVVPAGAMVLATVYPLAGFETVPAGANITLFPSVRNVDGLTATSLVDAPVIVGAPGGPDQQGIKAVVDPESSVITTEDCHLGAGLTVSRPIVASLVETMDDSTTNMSVGGVEDFPALNDFAPFLIQLENETMLVTAAVEDPDLDPLNGDFTVVRGQEGSTPAAHAVEDSTEISLAQLPDLSAGEAFIVFWIAPLSGTLPE